MITWIREQIAWWRRRRAQKITPIFFDTETGRSEWDAWY